MFCIVTTRCVHLPSTSCPVVHPQPGLLLQASTKAQELVLAASSLIPQNGAAPKTLLPFEKITAPLLAVLQRVYSSILILFILLNNVPVEPAAATTPVLVPDIL